MHCHMTCSPEIHVTCSLNKVKNSEVLSSSTKEQNLRNSGKFSSPEGNPTPATFFQFLDSGHPIFWLLVFLFGTFHTRPLIHPSIPVLSLQAWVQAASILSHVSVLCSFS
jgi:hypothetical protein